VIPLDEADVVLSRNLSVDQREKTDEKETSEPKRDESPEGLHGL